MSSAGNKFISNKEAVPLIESTVFDRNQQSRFAIGMFSAEEVMNNRKSPTIQAYLKLRANTYIDQTRMLPEEARQSDGTEIDKDDERSTHIIIIENKIGKSAVFACMRLIEKTDEYSNNLPVEDYFDETFINDPAPISSIEASRFIVRHDEQAVRDEAKLRLMTMGLTYSMNQGLGTVYAVVEPEFERGLKAMRLPLKRLANPKQVPEYNDENVAVEIDLIGYGSRLRRHGIKPLALPVGNFDYWGESENSEDDFEEVRLYGS
jgi:N-acyl-L-homoserine lactone synthetase